MVHIQKVLAIAALSVVQVQGVDLDINNANSIKSAASDLAKGMVKFYNPTEPGEVIGVLPPPYYWWEAGAMFNTLIKYWNLTGDSQYNDVVRQALIAQSGQGDYMPANQSASIGNDDQSTWGLAALSAELSGLSVGSSNSSWISAAIEVFNNQAMRWDEENCDGGLRWQIFLFNAGYNYKNTASNGQFFELAARLGQHTGNKTYLDWAEKVFEWTTTVGLIDEKWNVFDGAQVEQNCSVSTKTQFSLAAGTYIVGSALMYNATGDQKWEKTLDSLWERTIEVFFPSGSTGIAVESACEPVGTCTVDQRAYKGLLAQRLVDTVVYAPHTTNVIVPLLKANAEAAAKYCDAKDCFFNWTGNSTRIASGVGEYMNALSFVQGLLVSKAASGSSPANGTSGGATPTQSKPPQQTPNSAAGIGADLFLGSFAALTSIAWLL